MNSPLNLALFQTDIYWENPSANLASLEEKISQLEQKPDLIVLAETFNTGFTSKAAQFAEMPNMMTEKWLKLMASRYETAICGSYLVKDAGHIYNRFLFVYPDGRKISYNKRHLFSMGVEGDAFSPGKEAVIIPYKNWNIKPLICYDLRFPVWSRNANLQYDLLLYVANWPDARMDVFNTLLKARAIENQTYCLGVNRIGTDGNDIYYTGQSQVIDYMGKAIIQATSEEKVIEICIEKGPQDIFRQKFPVWKDADQFKIIE